MNAGRRLCVRAIAVWVVVAVWGTTGVCQISGLGDGHRARLDPVAQQRAKAWLVKRKAELKASGWKPKSREERYLTLMRVQYRKHERNMERAAQKAEFQAARAEAYQKLAGDFARIRVKYNVTRVRLARTRTGEVFADVRSQKGEYIPTAAIKAAAFYGNLAAKSAGIARAQRFRAETHYAGRIRNTKQRIAELESIVQAKRVAVSN